MNTLHKVKVNLDSNIHQMGDAASELVGRGKKLAHDLYQEGIEQVDCAQQKAEDYTEELVGKVRDNPLKSILIAGGIGFLISLLFKE